MSIKLIGILTVLMLANHIIGISYGAFKDGFSGKKLKYGTWKMLTALCGYAAIAFAAHYANTYISGIEYISGILMEPIAKYFLNVVNKLKQLVNEDVNSVILNKQLNKMNTDASEYFPLHSMSVSSSK